MGQPIKIYKEQKTAVVHGRSQLGAMLADGWQREPVTGGEDDLTRIKGIGNKRAQELRALGIYSFAGLATLSADFLAAEMVLPVPSVFEWIEAADKLSGYQLRDDS